MSQSERPAYYDIRSDLWKSAWDKAKSLEDFVSGASDDHKIRWVEGLQRIPELSEEMKACLQGYNRVIRVLATAGTWCLDCSRSLPYIKKIVGFIGEKAELRLIDRDAIPELRDELRIMGAPRVPVVVILSEDWFEVDRVGDRTLSIYKSRLAREIGRGTDHGVLSTQARLQELCEWVEVFERCLIILRTAPALRKRYGD